MHAQPQADKIFIIPDGTIVFEFIALFLLLFLLRRYVLPRLQTAMAERQETIKRQIDEAREAKERLDKAEQDYKTALHEARNEAAKLREEARSEGKRIIEEMRARAQEEAANISAAHQRQLEIDRQRTVAELRTEIGQLAIDLAGRIVGESLEDEARRRGTVDRFLAELEN
jgi:F-type H+-transporting ATPase subunit b